MKTYLNKDGAAKKTLFHVVEVTGIRCIAEYRPRLSSDWVVDVTITNVCTDAAELMLLCNDESLVNLLTSHRPSYIRQGTGADQYDRR